MQLILRRLSVSLLAAVLSVLTLHAQTDTTKPTSLDPKLIEWINARIPKEYTIAGISITGIRYLDTSIVYSIANLQSGDKFMHPGEDIFAKSIASLWRQKLFSNVQVYVSKIEDNKIWVEVNVQERPRLGNFKFIGIKKSEEDDLQGKINLAKQTIITENTRRDIMEKTQKYFSDKSYRNVQIRIEEKPDPAFVNSNALIIYIDKGKKVHINEIGFYGNKNVDGLRLKKQMKGTKEMSKLTLHADKGVSPFGEKTRYSFNEYIKDWGFLSLSKTKKLLDPWFRFKLLSSAKFEPKKFEEDKEKVLNYYNSIGYRDAQIVDTATYYQEWEHEYRL